MQKRFSRKHKKGLHSTSRTALHEAGHLTMALLLGMEVCRCALVPEEETWRPGELGRCTVLVPDPLGLRRFLLSMGGIMGEEVLTGKNFGGLQDRRDALEALKTYLAHYEDVERREELEEFFARVGEIFSREELRTFMGAAGKMLERERVLEAGHIAELEEAFPLLPEAENLRKELERFEKAPASPGWAGWMRGKALMLWEKMQRYRKPFEGGP